jgi:hypothetical protein
VLESPLEAGVEYEVRVSSIVNLNGLVGGGGEVTLVREAPSAPDSTAVPDSVPGNPPGGG